LKKDDKNRILLFEKLFKKKKRNNNQLIWAKYNPESQYGFDIESAEEDVEWMIYEIKRLQEENKRFKEFIDTLRKQMEKELNIET
jgi:hypothetical protein